MKKVNYYLAVVILSIVFGLLGYFNYLLFYPFKVADIKQPLIIHNPNKQIAIGEDIQFSIEYTKYMQVESTTERALLCKHNGFDTIIYLGNSKIQLPIGYHKYLSSAIKIPENTPKTECKLVLTVYYKINPFRTISQSVETENFKIK